MNLTVTKAWKSHQLATTEKIQRDIFRFTHPLLFISAVTSLTYLTIWTLVYCFWEAGFLPDVLPLVAAGAGLAVVLLFPAFVLALRVERAIENQLRR